MLLRGKEIYISFSLSHSSAGVNVRFQIADSPLVGYLFLRICCFKASSLSSHAAYHSHIQMAERRKAGFQLLSLPLPNHHFLKTIQLKPFVALTSKAYNILHKQHLCVGPSVVGVVLCWRTNI